MTVTHAFDLVSAVRFELLLFAATGFLVFGLDDLLVDLIWLTTRVPDEELVPTTADSIGQPCQITVFIPAWREAGVIEHMLARCLSAWGDDSYTIRVGFYPNDPETHAAITSLNSPLIIPVELDHAGPTTKADCLNGIWRSLLAERETPPAAIVIHDAEDYVHASELAVFRQKLRRYAMVQIPVVPLLNARSRWVSGHYLDEFAEAHLKELPVRQLIGAALPTAGTGCAFRTAALQHLASLREGAPFDDESLTEDYELGLRLGELGYRTSFVRCRAMGDLVAVRSHFPASLGTSVRQKSRWIAGIALSGWDRTGWHEGLGEHWMRWRDRRAILSAVLIIAAYCGAFLSLPMLLAGEGAGTQGALADLLPASAALLIWRLGMKAWCVWQVHGFTEALRSAPRSIVSNMVAVMAGYRALATYLRQMWTGSVFWEKTEHHFPQESPH